MKGKKSERARKACADEFYEDQLVFVEDKVLYNENVLKVWDFKDFNYEAYEKKLQEYSPDEAGGVFHQNVLINNIDQDAKPQVKQPPHREKFPNCVCFGHTRPNCSEGGYCAGLSMLYSLSLSFLSYFFCLTFFVFQCNLGLDRLSLLFTPSRSD
jgi:hypothetical protein